jgi:DNA-binding CsgD family transcriptional regulator/DNA-binding Lrp family transcriptional regulator
MSISADGTCVLGIRDAGVVDLLCDHAAMDTWNALRGARAIRTLRELADALRRPPAEVQASLDRLVDAGLVEVRRARGLRTATGYAARHRSLVIAHEPDWDGPLVERVVSAMAEAAEAARMAAGDGTGARSAAASGPLNGRFVAIAPLDQYALSELHRRIMDVIDYMRALGMVAAEGDGSRAAVAPAVRAVIDLSSLGSAPSSHAAVTLLPRPAVERDVAPARGRVADPNALTRREWDVAAMLAAGSLRPEISRRLGISTNTVASIAKSVYRKLGVHSRGELAVRLRRPSAG